MAILLPSSSTFKSAVFITGVSVVTAAAVNFSAPVVAHFAACYFPIIYDNAVFFLRPPYLYLVINCIIVSIVASSRFQKHSSTDGDSHFPEAAVPVPSGVSAYLTADYVADYSGSIENKYLRDESSIDRTKEDSQSYPEVITEKLVIDGCDDRRKMEKSKLRSDSTEFLMPKAEKPPASARFGQRKAIKATAEGVSKTTALGVYSKPRRQDTLETTWRKITEGRSMPLTRHLKKSDTWEKESSHEDGDAVERTTKSENLDSRSSEVETRRRRRERLVREASPGQEELNRRVEAFINKFNEEMRLQRLESLAKYQELVYTGAPS